VAICGHGLQRCSCTQNPQELMTGPTYWQILYLPITKNTNQLLNYIGDTVFISYRMRLRSPETSHVRDQKNRPPCSAV